MRSVKIFAVVILTTLSSVGVHAAAVSRVVLSNLGSNGLTDTSQNDLNGTTATTLFATGFTTGSVAQTLDSVRLVVASDDSVKTVSLYSSTALPDAVPVSSIATSLGLTVSAKGMYNFLFAGESLAANTTYWIVPGAGLNWYRAMNTLGDIDPTVQNSSGFTFAGVRRSQNSGVDWTVRTQRYTVSIFTTDVTAPPPPPPPPDVIPEPALTTMMCFGGIALIRRRLKK